MNYISITGLIGAIILVTGSAWPDSKNKHPAKSVKNWLLAIGALTMLTYAIFNYLQGGSIFFAFLQGLVVISSIPMMFNTSEKITTPIVILCGILLIIWSLYLFESYNTIFFIIGLSGISLGYVFRGTLRRNVALMLGGVLIALFSYIEASWIFFWLNFFFTAFSGYYVYKELIGQHEQKTQH